jgi:hypothetical protein
LAPGFASDSWQSEWKVRKFSDNIEAWGKDLWEKPLLAPEQK